MGGTLMYLKVGPLHGPGFPFAYQGWKSRPAVDMHEQLCHIVLLLRVGPGFQKFEPGLPSVELYGGAWGKQRAQHSTQVTELRVTR